MRFGSLRAFATRIECHGCGRRELRSDTEDSALLRNNFVLYENLLCDAFLNCASGIRQFSSKVTQTQMGHCLTAFSFCQVATFAVNYVGHPFNASITENKPFYYALLSAGVFFWVVSAPVPGNSTSALRAHPLQAVRMVLHLHFGTK
jgi:magnesium-transporting ATPase (P-type)